ncbi:hypothetical protein VTI74DRAFT_863 [Chaetomium olivicolor]
MLVVHSVLPAPGAAKEEANVLSTLLATRHGKCFQAECRRDSSRHRRIGPLKLGGFVLSYRLDPVRPQTAWGFLHRPPSVPDLRFMVAAAVGPASFHSPSESPPNSAEATGLLIQFCAIYRLLGPEHQPDDHQPELSPATTAFLAALVLPFYRSDGLRPQFPSPILKRCSAGTAKGATREAAWIRQYAADLRYYMTPLEERSGFGPMSFPTVPWPPGPGPLSRSKLHSLI